MRPGVIITGADGFIGSATVRYFLEQGWRVLALDWRNNPTRLVGHPLLTYKRYNVADIYSDDSIAALTDVTHDYEYFIHFAWEGTTGCARELLDIQIKNARAAANCVGLAKSLGCTKFIGAGSLMEYEIAQTTHSNNTNSDINFYGFGKQLAHYMCKKEGMLQNIEVVWGIITNVYGPGETTPRFLKTTIEKVIKNEPLEFSSGTQNYDFVYIEDAARAFYRVALYGINNEEYLIGSGNAKPLKEFIQELVDTIGTDENQPIFNSDKIVDCALPIETFSLEKTAELGFYIITPFNIGIQKTAEWIKSQLEETNEIFSIEH